MACAALSATVPWGIRDESGLECRTEERAGKVLFCSWVVMTESCWGAVSRCEIRGALGQEHPVLRNVRGSETRELLWGRESPGWTHQAGMGAPPHSPGENVCAQNIESALFKLLRENDSECCESSRSCAQTSGALAGDARCRWHSCHGQSSLSSAACLEDAAVPRCLGR